MQPNTSHEAHESGNRPDEMSSEKPLESWKEIAAYLQRNAVTVRRWEREEGLPIHRHRHKSRASVYAFPSELDAWREGRKPDAESEPERMALWGSPWSSFATAALLMGALLWVGNTASEVQAQGVPEGTAARLIWHNADPQGTITPDGRYMSVSHWDTDSNVALRDLTTGEDRTLADEHADRDYTEQSAISRDGSQVAYAYFRRTGYELRVVDTAQPSSQTSRRIDVGPEVAWLGPWDWSPDGEWISVTVERKDGTTEVDIVSATDGTVRTLRSHDQGYPVHISFSPDGRFLAYDVPVTAGGQRDITILSVDGGQEQTIQQLSNDVVMDWTPDGDALLFSSDRSGSPGLWSIPVRDGVPTGAPNLLKPGFESSAGFMTDSGSLYYTFSIGRLNGMTAEFDFNSGQLLSDPTIVDPKAVGTNSRPQWSPDGSQLAYHAGKGIRILSKDSGQVREFLSQLRGIGGMRWYPDGNALAILGGDPEGRHGIFRLDLSSGTASPVVVAQMEDIYTISAFDWFPGKNAILYSLWLPGEQTYSLRSREIATGAEQELFRHPEIKDVAASPDGQWIALVARDSEPVDEDLDNLTLRVLPAEGGGPRTIMTDLANVGKVGWAPDSQSMLVWTSDGTWQAFPSDREPRKLDVDLGPGPVSTHPDGRQIAYWTANWPIWEIWALENFLP